jgi:hypothetical protein
MIGIMMVMIIRLGIWNVVVVGGGGGGILVLKRRVRRDISLLKEKRREGDLICEFELVQTRNVDLITIVVSV